MFSCCITSACLLPDGKSQGGRLWDECQRHRTERQQRRWDERSSPLAAAAAAMPALRHTTATQLP